MVHRILELRENRYLGHRRHSSKLKARDQRGFVQLVDGSAGKRQETAIVVKVVMTRWGLEPVVLKDLGSGD